MASVTGDWGCLQEQVLPQPRSEAPPEDFAGSQSQAQEETEGAMSKAALWVSRPKPCLPLPRQQGAVGGRPAPSGGAASRSTSV